MFEKMKRNRKEFLERKAAYREEYEKASKEYGVDRLEKARERARLDARRAAGCLTDEDKAILNKERKAKQQKAKQFQNKMDNIVDTIGG